MEVFIVEYDREKSKVLSSAFKDEADVTVVNSTFQDFITSNDVDCVVSPANSFGLMDGGYDAAITDYFGNELQKKVQEKIIREFGGHQTVGTALTVDATENCKLIHVPTMCVPSRIKDPFIIYECTRSALFEAKKHGCKRVVLPAFGGLTGGVRDEVVAKMMLLGYIHFNNPNKTISWDVAYEIADAFKKSGIPIV